MSGSDVSGSDGRGVRVEVVDDGEALARLAAAEVAARVRAAAERGARFSFAVSGGRTPWAMFGHLRDEDVPWQSVDVFQVDERVAPDGHPDRNLTHLVDALAGLPHAPLLHPMRVTADDLERAAAEYAALLPERFDLVHLGLGADGHTASLVPDDAVLEVTDRDVALTGEYQGRRRMTLTYPVLDRAREVLWLVGGADKASPLDRLLAGDHGIPAGRVSAARQLVLADRAARP
jgi:6-phosphogluconolactonase